MVIDCKLCSATIETKPIMPKAKLYKQFPRESCYVIYEQPYYKLRVGDFTNRFEATDLLNQMLISLFRSVYRERQSENKIIRPASPSYCFEHKPMLSSDIPTELIKAAAEKYFERVVAIRRTIHAHPELAYERA